MTNRNHTNTRRRAGTNPRDTRTGRRRVPEAQGSSPTRKDPRRRTGIARPGHRWTWWTTLPITTVVLAVLTLVAIALSSGATPGTSPLRIGSDRAVGSGAVPLPAAVQQAVTSVGGATLRDVGTPAGLAGPTIITNGHAPLVGPDGKPEILYVGAEYCPYCAAERWALVVALSHFGSFSGLKATHSSTSDIYPDTPTLSFYGSTFTSARLDFMAVELATNQAVAGQYPTLQALTPGQQSVLDSYDRSPYSPQPGAIPFIDLDNRFVLIGASYDPAVLEGKSVTQIARALSHPSSPIAQDVDGTANLLVAAISHATGIQPNP